MYVVSLTYVVDLDVVARHRQDHLDWLQGYYDSGMFLASGPKVPLEGGVILAHGVTRAQLDEILRTDPFAVHGLARYEIIEFEAKMTCPAFRAILSKTK